MKVKCKIKVMVNSSSSAAAGCDESSSKGAVDATLFVSKMADDNVFLVYCTAKDKQGIKYKVKDNVERIVKKYNHEGRATIQLKDPPITICVYHSQPPELKTLLTAVKLASKGDSLESGGFLSAMPCARTEHVESPNTKMTVLSQQDYPFVLGFPTTLTSLTISHCGLFSIDSQIATLKSLVELNLSSNNLQQVSETFSSLNQLLSLDLSGNEIERLQSSVFLQNFKLNSLNLSYNKLKGLPNSIGRLENLRYLNISHNRIKSLPRHINQLCSLEVLQTSHNNLLFLPISILRLPMISSIDFSKNPFGNFRRSGLYKRFNFDVQDLNLQRLCGKVIRNKKIFYNNVDIMPYPLICYLNSALPCMCKTYCFDDNVYFIPGPAVITINPTAADMPMRDYVLNDIYLEAGVCSTNCLTLWKRHLGFSHLEL